MSSADRPPQGDASTSPVPTRPRHRALGLVAGALLVALLGGAAGGAAGWTLGHDTNSATGAESVSTVAKTVLPSVVTIQVGNSSGQVLGTGSGFVIRANGYIATNNHVANAGGSGEKLVVQFQDGSESTGRVVGSDSSYDLAVVKVDKAGLTPLRFGDSKKLVVGQQVVAVGSPLGLQGSVTSGIVSAVNRPVQAGGSQTAAASDTSYIDAVQTDAAINHGNSGGPLIDLDGRVIGVNSAIASSGSSGGSIGVGFAIPSDQVKRTTDELISTGKSSHPVIGITFDQAFIGPGIKVTSVTSGGPSSKAGIKAGDVITSLDGQKISDATAFIVALRSKPVGQPVTLVITSNGSSRTVAVTTAAASDK